MSEAAVRAELVALDALPDAARALFGGDAFSTPAWYDSVARTALPACARACAIVVWRAGDVLGVVPVCQDAGGLSALTTPYTVRWGPLFRPGLAAEEVGMVGQACGRLWRHWPLTRLDAIAAEAAWLPPFLAGARRAGLVALRFDHFGNWHGDVSGLDWEHYLATRPGALRSTFRRRSKMFAAPGAFLLVTGREGLDAALAAYARVYAASWKQPEPYPAFNAALMRGAAQDGSLRLGVLRLDGAPVAAQFWLVHGGWAGVQKLAHDEAFKALAPGTVLTGLMLRHLLDREHVHEIDFGRGDDAYKHDWAKLRRQRIGVVLAAPWRARGLLAIARHGSGRLRHKFRRAGHHA